VETILPLPDKTPRNFLKEKMADGKLTVGMIARLVRGAEIAAIAHTAGFDCLFIDLEHNSFTLESVSQICLTCNALQITPLVRVLDRNPTNIGRALECGAMGVIVPGVETPSDAAAVVAAAKYPPLGERSIAPHLPHLFFRAAPAQEVMPALNEATLVVTMMESIAALEAIEEIATVDGVDMVLVGANDLCNAMGLPGQPDHPKVRAAFERVAAACTKAGVFFGVGGLGSRPELAKEMIALGARYVTAGADVTFLVNAATANAKSYQ
jgi:2-keto-3-deoxy-L-rhamnonate aldolase RhmA